MGIWISYTFVISFLFFICIQASYDNFLGDWKHVSTSGHEHEYVNESVP